MKGIICYYSGSGNTKLAVKYIKRKMSSVDFTLYDIVKNDIPDVSVYDIVGFATFTDFLGVPQYFYTFFDKMSPQHNKYAFVFNTFGNISGKTLKALSELARSKNFTILSGHSLHTPESYPPMRVKNKAFDDSPNQKELKRFDDFILRLESMVETIKSGKIPKNERIKISLLSTILPAFQRTKAKKDFGEQNVEKSLCKKCGTCKKVCPYGAIELKPNPVFDHKKCWGCWACYNHCPEKAIYTKKFHGEGQYPKPIKELVKKLERNVL